MKKEAIHNYYTDEDLINFNKLNKFEKIRSNKLVNNQTTKHPVKYSISDNNNFKRIMNTENGKTSLSKEFHDIKENTYYNSSDFQKFNKLKQFTNFNTNKDSIAKNEYSKTQTNYTSDDVNKFDKIIKTRDESINNPKTNNKKIKIIDFDKTNKKGREFKNKAGIEKIKVIYFD